MTDRTDAGDRRSAMGSAKRNRSLTWWVFAALCCLIAATAFAEDGLFRGFRVDPAWAPGAGTSDPWLPTPVRPVSHDAAWLTQHGAAAAAPGGDCLSCHVEDTCASCHAGANVAPSVHPAGYVMLHAGDALQDTASCASCHTTTRFCQSCHVEAALSGQPGWGPPTWANVHPPNWLDPAGLNNHAAEARSDLLSCASCHTGDECATCHISVNPHGSDFANRCRPMLQAAEPTCARCHTLNSTLPVDALREHPGCAR